MNGFENMLLNDMQNVLFNSNELAGKHLDNGAEVGVIIDNRRLEKLKANCTYSEQIATASTLVLVRASDVAKPAEGSFWTFDKNTYRVLNVTESGLGAAIFYEIALEANE